MSAQPAPILAPAVAAARAKHPGARLILIHDLRPGSPEEGRILAVPPHSQWHAMLPPFQIVYIRPKHELVPESWTWVLNLLAEQEEIAEVRAVAADPANLKS